MTQTANVSIVRSTTALARDLGLRTFIDGIEDQAVYELLGELGCDAVQGFFVGRPMPLDELIGWLGVSAFASMDPLLAEARSSDLRRRIDLAAANVDPANGRSGREGLALLERDAAGIALALDWTLQTSAVAQGLELAWSLRPFLFDPRRARATRTYLEAALARPVALTSELEARTKTLLAACCAELGDMPAALGQLTDAIALMRSGSELLLANGLNNLGIAQVIVGDWPNARATNEEAVLIRRRIGDTPGVGHSLTVLAAVAINSGDLDSGVRYASESVAVLRTVNDVGGLAHALDALGSAQLRVHRLTEAKQALLESLRLFASFDSPDWVMVAVNLAAIALQAGRERDGLLLAGAITRLAGDVRIPASITWSYFMSLVASARASGGAAASDAWWEGRALDGPACRALALSMCLEEDRVPATAMARSETVDSSTGALVGSATASSARIGEQS
jgi:Flp pilus assembly protein TadD